MHLSYKTFVLFFLIIAISFLTAVQAREKTEQIDKLMQLYHDYGQFNGTVLVSEKGKVIFKKGYGLANMEWGIVNKPDTKMRLGSITKQFTAMLIMQLAEKGKISLDAKITMYLPDYRKDTGDKVSVHHLLTHTSGIPSYTSMPGFFRDVSRDPYSVDAFVEKYCSGDLEFEPGSQHRYNNSGYFLLGAIIEKVTGKTYEQALQENIFDPLGMKDTGYDHHGPIMKRRATGYEKTFDGYVNSAYLDMSLPYAAGALYSTVEDLYIWDQALYSDKLISAEYREKMFTPFLNDYAYGWGVRKRAFGGGDSLLSIGHGGGINGFNTLITRLVEDRHLIVLLNNTGGTNLDGMTESIVSILYGREFDTPKPFIADVLYKTIKEKNIQAATDQYRQLKKDNPEGYDFSEGQLNRLGYQLLSREKNISGAIKIFKLNVEAYPDAYNTYDSLGEALMRDGQDELAIKNYKKSLELNPRNKNAEEMIKKITEKK